MRSVLWLKVMAVLAGTLVLTGCPGEKSDAQPQQAAPRIESTGTVTDGVNLRQQDIVAKGVSGITRETNTDGSGAFTLNMTDLSGPFLFSNSRSATGNPGLIFLLGPATKVGPTNVTPLTTLLTAQLLGVTPANVFQTYNTSLPKDRITEDNIRAAQADLTAFLQDALGVPVKSGDASFIDAPFKTNVGDPMYDTILALNAKMTADGTTLTAVAERIAIGVQACLTEKIQISIGGQQRKFCPVAKSDVPEEADTSILDYKFRDITNAVLLVKVRENTVLSVDFTTATNVTYSCAGGACAGVSLGAVAADESRPIVFGSVALTENGGGALVDGTLIGPPPLIEMPTLPCTENRFFVILSNHSVIGDCLQPQDPFQLGASLGGPQTVGRVAARFDGQNMGAFTIVVDSTSPDFPAVSVYYSDSDPDTSQPRNRFLCRFAECTGVTWGKATTDTSSGFPLELRTITLDNTMLTGLNEDGTPNGMTATVRASGLVVFIPGETITYPSLMDCDPAADTISVGAISGEFNLCIPPNDPNFGFFRGVTDYGDGFVQLTLQDDTFNQVIILGLLNGILESLAVQPPGGNGETYSCRTDCSGITVNGPDSNGAYTVSFANAVVHKEEAYPLPGDRTLTLTSGDILIPPF